MNIKFIQSNEIKISLNEEQIDQISSPDIIRNGCKQKDVIAYDIFDDDELVGFAMLKQFSRGSWFLWNYAIDKKFQGLGLGFRALEILLKIMKENFCASEITTTYRYGNERAKNLYKKIGFAEIDSVDEPSCREVNMLLELKNV
ncbi:GNAT family N-acetyltransferase [Facklamia miroungae]|uniref:Acetyltransferase (GNAT) family protein n=1 Tax=Facklamia miroungae TaxID=120956 RepID=A0A1G7QBE3_9LACT|nr:GNAT family N-acetyltransferase [Facklamia miroungae]NKZ28861.1 GNAT family N-acetyltransferase [Facklamia miroungae]SDF94910.1 Acetyltransferase (GNAT) family protein [Facklamia miroungae]